MKFQRTLGSAQLDELVGKKSEIWTYLPPHPSPPFPKLAFLLRLLSACQNLSGLKALAFRAQVFFRTVLLDKECDEADD